MFGSKIRSWMENHITRPRKKGTKNKNGSSSNNSSTVPTTNFNTQSGYLNTSYGLYNADNITGSTTMAVIGNGSNSVPSPAARRHEVSPIQCHKTSRFGWHSPTHGNNKNLMSPKTEHFLKMQHHTDSKLHNNSNNIKQEQITATTTTFKGNQENTYATMYNNNHNNNNNNNNNNHNNSNSKNNNSQQKYVMTTATDERNHKINSNSNIEMSKNKCFSNQQQQQQQQQENFKELEQKRYQQQQQQQLQQHQHKHRTIHSYQNQREFSDEQNNKFQCTDNKNRNIKNNYDINTTLNMGNHIHHRNTIERDLTVQYSDQNHFKRITEFEIKNGGQKSKGNIQNNNNNNNNVIKNSTKLCPEKIPDTKSTSSSFAKTYKKIFSSSSSTTSNDRTAVVKIMNENSYDEINANLSPHYYEHQYQQIPDNHRNGNNNNNSKCNGIINNNSGNQKLNKEKMKRSERSQLTESGYYEMIPNSTHQHHQATVHTAIKPKNPSYEINRIKNMSNYLAMGSTNLHLHRNGRQNNTLGPIQQPQQLASNSNHPLAHVINSLSSPESAYSTGYSTDGTSPGTTYTPPEYYINMRTGTHYFAKNSNSLGVELSRQKFGLNKIEEIMSTHHHRRTESYDVNQIKIIHNELIDEQFMSTDSFQQLEEQHLQHLSNTQLQSNNTLTVNLRGYESPSPRQRCRIRTNPWYSTPENSFSATSQSIKKTDMDTSSSSSGIKSNSDIRTSLADDEKSKDSSEVSDDESDSSSTEVEVDISKKLTALGTIKLSNAAAITRPLSTEQVFNAMDLPNPNKNNNIQSRSFKSDTFSANLLPQDSDEDTTLNEMMGKFDESYIYEKETDILSNDSDPTRCNSDIDTGQDAGDEYDTEDLLDIDFIDTGSIQEIVEAQKNTGSCSYFNYNSDKRSLKTRMSRKQNVESAGGTNSSSGKRRKRLLKTRKKSCDSKERTQSPMKHKRESRSVGGTPVSLRRKITGKEKKSDIKISPLVQQQRSNSLTFTDVHTVREKYMAIAESEKMLLKADLEADIKYKQLIHEAETILVSMKANAFVAPRETPVASPSRRILNPPANKRVEMLRQCEADIKREIQKHQQQQQLHPNADAYVSSEHLINKRLELLKHEYNACNSVPASPKCGRLSPRKTHLTNFINQIASSDIAWRNPTSTKNRSNEHLSSEEQPIPNIRCNRNLGRKSCSPPPHQPPPPPPVPRRSFGEKSSNRQILTYINSDSDDDSHAKPIKSMPSDSTRLRIEENNEQEYDSSNKIKHFDINNISKTIDNDSKLISDPYHSQFEDFDNPVRTPNKQPLISFKSIDMGNKGIEMGGYCPQSEPLKRKIYQGSSSFERIKKNLDIESEIPKQNMLNRINSIRRDRQIDSNRSSTQDINANMKNLKLTSNQNNQDNSAYHSNDEDSQISIISNLSVKQQLILNTIEDLKKSLEDQSVELTAQFDN